MENTIIMKPHICDYHIHTRFSTDSEGDVRKTIERAIELGMSAMAVTDHQDFGYPGEDFKLKKCIDEYCDTLLNLKKEYEDKIFIALGCEVGLEADKPEVIDNYVKSNPFDYIIGSSHLVYGVDIYYPDFYKDKTSEEAIKIYFQSVLENLEVCKNFDIYGHIDYVVRYCPDKAASFTYDKFKNYLDEIIKRIVEEGKGIEINTGGYRNGLGEPNPCFEVLKKYKELGGSIITFGSDAHEPKVVGADFDRAAEMARLAGFKEYYIYKEREPVAMGL